MHNEELKNCAIVITARLEEVSLELERLVNYTDDVAMRSMIEGAMTMSGELIDAMNNFRTPINRSTGYWKAIAEAKS